MEISFCWRFISESIRPFLFYLLFFFVFPTQLMRNVMQVRNELPSTFKAYRYQQHRWSCGPANLFRKMFKEIIFCEVSKLHNWTTVTNQLHKYSHISTLESVMAEEVVKFLVKDWSINVNLIFDAITVED